MPSDLAWLPVQADWSGRIKQAEAAAPDWRTLVGLAQARLDFLATERLDRLLQRHFPEPPEGLQTRPVRLAVLASSTVQQLLGSIRVAALRRGLHVTIHKGEYGQYLQELLEPDPALQAFRPDTVLLSLDAAHLASVLPPGADAQGAEDALAAQLAQLRRAWEAARRLGASVIQQTALPVLPALLGANEHRFPGSPAAFIERLNARLRPAADEAGVHLLAVEQRAAQFGVRSWHDPTLWHHAKQEISGKAAPVYGELAARLLAALQGRSAKALVLDLDNTLWGGVIGDDGVEGISLGQGSALGEAFVAIQRYAKQLSGRGVVLAVCSKNDEANALEPFARHPDMVLKRDDIASFVANWDDKATNIRRIARELNLGLDALVFLDDNPFERNLVRGEIPEISVPELPDDDPALFADLLADAGYFETVTITDDDRRRSAQYQENRERAQLAEQATDLPAYLRSLDMKLVWTRFDRVGLTRIVQLINKSNQFNLTTRRASEEGILAVMADPRAFGLQLRLLDRFGDNGVIAIVIGKLTDNGADCVLHTWLMSCRVLGRQVEQATLQLAAAEARRLGADRLVGEYVPSAKNGMVREHYGKLGFAETGRDEAGATTHALELATFRPEELFMQVIEGGQG